LTPAVSSELELTYLTDPQDLDVTSLADADTDLTELVITEIDVTPMTDGETELEP
jgi:hypothetical protein